MIKKITLILILTFINQTFVSEIQRTKLYETVRGSQENFICGLKIKNPKIRSIIEIELHKRTYYVGADKKTCHLCYYNKPHNKMICKSTSIIIIGRGQLELNAMVPYLYGDPTNFTLVHLKEKNQLVVWDKKSGQAVIFQIIGIDLYLLKNVDQVKEMVRQVMLESKLYNNNRNI